jgi:hypothetical protein
MTIIEFFDEPIPHVFETVPFSRFKIQKTLHMAIKKTVKRQDKFWWNYSKNTYINLKSRESKDKFTS